MQLRQTGNAFGPSLALVIGVALLAAVVVAMLLRSRVVRGDTATSGSQLDFDEVERGGLVRSLVGVLGRVTPLVVLVVGGALAFLISCLLTKVAILSVVIKHDRPIYSWFLHRRNGHLTTVAADALTRPGDYDVIFATTIIVGAYFLIRYRQVLPVILLALGVALEKYLQLFTNHAVHAAKPNHLLAVGPIGGCPSGGVARVVVTFGLVAYLVLRSTRSPEARVLVWGVWALMVFVEGWSRLYLGRHWPIDTVVGLFFGLLILSTLILVDRTAKAGWRRSKPSPSAELKEQPAERAFSA